MQCFGLKCKHLPGVYPPQEQILHKIQLQPSIQMFSDGKVCNHLPAYIDHSGTVP